MGKFVAEDNVLGTFPWFTDGSQFLVPVESVRKYPAHVSVQRLGLRLILNALARTRELGISGCYCNTAFVLVHVFLGLPYNLKTKYMANKVVPCLSWELRSTNNPQ